MKLGRRERYLVIFAACSLGVFFLFQLLFFPFLERRERIKRGLMAKEKALREVLSLSAEYRSYKAGSLGLQDILARRKTGFTLFSFLEGAAGDALVKGNIKYMRPSVFKGSGPYEESMVEMKLEEISLEQLVDYLRRIESPQNAVGIKRISIKQNNRDPGYLDAILQVVTLKQI
ncbi:MAG: hypothetical protein V1689_04900 [Pseudomonadota bacterium]